MNVRKCLPLLSAVAVAASVGPVLAETATMRQLMADGFEIKTATAVSRDELQRAFSPEWQDGFLVTLQNGGRLAMCHGTLAATGDAATFIDYPCTVSTDVAASPAGPTTSPAAP